MNLKYYLRGLGIGVVVTAVIMSVAAGRRTATLSNAEIRERARALGMVEPSGVLTEFQGDGQAENEPGQKGPDMAVVAPTPTPYTESVISPETLKEPEASEGNLESPSPEPEASTEPSAIPSPSLEPIASPSSAPIASPEASPSKAPSTEREPADTSVIIVVRSGESSYTICRKLEDAGVVSSASAFDSFLCSRGYDTKLRTGTFEIPMDAEPEEIAKILVPGS